MINPVFLIVLPLLLAFLTMILKNQRKIILISGGILNVVFAVLTTKGTTIIGGFEPPYGINLLVDDYSLIGVILINVLFLSGILISTDIAQKYTPVLLTALAGINGIILTGDLFNLFVFMEITAVSAYILSSSTKKFRHSFNYLILGSVGAVFYLLGIILIYSLTGSLNMADISMKVAGLSDKQLFVPMILIFTGIAVEAKLMPMSGWVKGVYSNADRLTGSLFSSIFAAGILFVFGRIFADVFSVDSGLKIIMVILCTVTFVLGEISAFKQARIKKILMFSSIAQAGLAALLLISGLVFPAVLLIISNAAGKMIMFSSAGMMEEKYGTDDYNKLKGVFLKNVLVGVAFTISAFSIIGLPFFLGFYGKLNSLFGLFAMDDYVLPAVILLVTIVEGAYFIKLLVSLWAPGEEGQEADEVYSVKENKLFGLGKVVIIFALSLMLLGAGILPDLFGDLISKDHKLLNESGIVYDITSMKGGK